MNQIYNLKVKEGGHIDKRTKSNDKQTNKLTTLPHGARRVRIAKMTRLWESSIQLCLYFHCLNNYYVHLSKSTRFKYKSYNYSVRPMG